jgi:hypothetical protein
MRRRTSTRLAPDPQPQMPVELHEDFASTVGVSARLPAQPRVPRPHTLVAGGRVGLVEDSGRRPHLSESRARPDLEPRTSSQQVQRPGPSASDPEDPQHIELDLATEAPEARIGTHIPDAAVAKVVVGATPPCEVGSRAGAADVTLVTPDWPAIAA